MNKSDRVPVYGLDIIRLFAALLVVIYHFGFKAWATPGNPLLTQMKVAPGLPAWHQGSWWGWVGVQIFFVISGAVIAYSAQGVGAADFFKRRFARLFPSLLICATFALAIAVLAFGTPVFAALTLWLKTIVFFPTGPWIIGQFWTLPIEVAFYGVVLMLIVAGQVQRLEALAWALGTISAAYWIATLAHIAPGGRLIELLLLQHGCYFSLGVLVAGLDWKRLRFRHAFLAGLCLVAAAIQMKTAASWEVPTYPGVSSQWATPYLVWLAATVLIAASFRFKTEIAAAAAPCGRPLRILGLITYPLYLIHIHAGGPILVQMHNAGFAPPACIAAAVAAGLIAACVVAIALEPPLHRGVLAALYRPRLRSRVAG